MCQCNRVLNYEEIRNLTEPRNFRRSRNILTESRTLITYADTRVDTINPLRRALSSEPNFAGAYRVHAKVAKCMIRRSFLWRSTTVRSVGYDVL